MRITSQTADQRRMAYRFIPGRGYIEQPMLLPPESPEFPPSAAEPVHGTASGTVHLLRSSKGGEAQRLSWDAERREWVPPLGLGRRIGFSSAYMAAVGWQYVEPVA